MRHLNARGWFGWGFGLFLTLALLVGIVLPLWLGPAGRAFVMQVFAPFCHQLPARSPHVDGVQLAVCHRCLGIYVGLAGALAAYLAVLRWDRALYAAAPVVLAVSLLPMGIDWIGDVLGWWTNTPTSRVVTGAFFGLGAGLLFARAMVRVFAAGQKGR